MCNLGRHGWRHRSSVSDLRSEQGLYATKSVCAGLVCSKASRRIRLTGSAASSEGRPLIGEEWPAVGIPSSVSACRGDEIWCSTFQLVRASRCGLKSGNSNRHSGPAITSTKDVIAGMPAREENVGQERYRSAVKIKTMGMRGGKVLLLHLQFYDARGKGRNISVLMCLVGLIGATSANPKRERLRS